MSRGPFEAKGWDGRYEKIINKDKANGYVGLGAGGKIDAGVLSTHAHSADDITSGVFDPDRLPKADAVTPVDESPTVLDTGIEPSALNTFGPSGLEQETRLKVNELRTWIGQIQSKFADEIQALINAGYQEP